MKYMTTRLKTQKSLFFQRQDLKTKVKIKPDGATIFEIIKVAKQVILVERLGSFVCYADKALLQHPGSDTYSNLLQVLNYGYVSIRFPLQEREFLLCEQCNIHIPTLFLKSIDVSTFFCSLFDNFGLFLLQIFLLF